MPILPGSSGNDPMLFYTLSVVGLILGLLVVFGALMFRTRPRYNKVWGAMIVAFSLPSVRMGGGVIIGFILGVIGGKSTYSRKPGNQAK
jgi:hypothetical protein